MSLALPELLRLFEQDQRLELEYYGARRVRTAHTIRMVHDESIGGGGYVIFADLDAYSADEAIQSEVAFFKEQGGECEWKLYTHDTPSDLQDRLRAAGFEIGEEETVMVLDLEDDPRLLRREVTSRITRITSASEVARALSIQSTVWGDKTDLSQMIASELERDAPHISLYVAHEDGKPVSSAWIRFKDHGTFASLWGGATLPDHRNRGHYSSLLAVRAQEAAQRGIRFLTVDASPFSRPILARFGFRAITRSYPCSWSCNRAGPASGAST